MIELVSLIRSRKRFWLAPVMLMTVMLGGLLLLAQGSVAAPFIYAIF
jgi:hypothetical protein